MKNITYIVIIIIIIITIGVTYITNINKDKVNNNNTIDSLLKKNETITLELQKVNNTIDSSINIFKERKTIINNYYKNEKTYITDANSDTCYKYIKDFLSE